MVCRIMLRARVVWAHPLVPLRGARPGLRCAQKGLAGGLRNGCIRLESVQPASYVHIIIGNMSLARSDVTRILRLRLGVRERRAGGIRRRRDLYEDSGNVPLRHLVFHSGVRSGSRDVRCATDIHEC